MTTARAKKYLETQVKTANKEQLLLMLFDGGMRFARLAKEHLRADRPAEAFEHLKRSQKIAMELMCSLDRSIDSEIYSSLASLYKFIYFRLVEAALRKSEEMIDDALDIYAHLRETWAIAIENNRRQNPDITKIAPQHGQTPCAISVQG